MLTNFTVLCAFCVGALGATVAVVDPVAPINVPLQYGALGLLGVMIWFNSQERKQMVKTIEAKDEKLMRAFNQFASIGKDMADAARQMNKVASVCHKMAGGAVEEDQ